MTYYAAAGLGYGVDISHYGAPYQGMLGVDGLGQTTWTPGPGQMPADDPRMVKKYAVVRSLYRVRNVPRDKAGRLADLLLARARALYPGNTVRKVGTTGWTNDGRVGFEVSLANATRAGEIKQRNAGARSVAAQLGGGAELYDAQTFISPSDYMPLEDTMLPPGEQPVATESAPASRTVGGLPIWAVAGIGAAAIGAIAFVALRKKPVAANRTRRRSRRRMSRNGAMAAPPGFVARPDGGALVEEYKIERRGGHWLGDSNEKTRFGGRAGIWAIPKDEVEWFDEYVLGLLDEEERASRRTPSRRRMSRNVKARTRTYEVEIIGDEPGRARFRIRAESNPDAVARAARKYVTGSPDGPLVWRRQVAYDLVYQYSERGKLYHGTEPASKGLDIIVKEVEPKKRSRSRRVSKNPQRSFATLQDARRQTNLEFTKYVASLHHFVKLPNGRWVRTLGRPEGDYVSVGRRAWRKR